VAGLVLGTLLLLGFVAREAYAREPMIPLGLFHRTSFSAAVGTQFLLAAAIFSAVFLTSQFFQFALGNSPLGAGLRFLPWTAPPLFIAPVAGRLSDKVGARALIVPAWRCRAQASRGSWRWPSTSASYGRYVLPFIIAGVGISMAIPCVTVAGLNAAPPALLGKAAGTLNTMQQFGAVFGIAIVTAVFNSKGSLASPAAVTSGYRPALAVAAGLSVLGAVVAIGIRKTTRTPAPGVSIHQIRPSSPDLARQKYGVVLPMESEVGRS
jgi:MFS family permease